MQECPVTSKAFDNEKELSDVWAKKKCIEAASCRHHARTKESNIFKNQQDFTLHLTSLLGSTDVDTPVCRIRIKLPHNSG